ncbi:hypothetical protein DLM45_12145 [Hyphomicrobium methylovorum]|nr:hypothetical protein [Hyphomicrobium methylovorum]
MLKSRLSVRFGKIKDVPLASYCHPRAATSMPVTRVINSKIPMFPVILKPVRAPARALIASGNIYILKKNSDSKSG